MSRPLSQDYVALVYNGARSRPAGADDTSSDRLAEIRQRVSDLEQRLEALEQLLRSVVSVIRDRGGRP